MPVCDEVQACLDAPIGWLDLGNWQEANQSWSGVPQPDPDRLKLDALNEPELAGVWRADGKAGKE